MARTTRSKTTLLGSYPTLPVAADSADLVLTAVTGSSGSNGDQIDFGDFRALLVAVQNSHASNAYTVTFTSKADSKYNRTGDISGYSLAAGEIGVFYFERAGWRQSDGMLYLEGNNAAIKVGAVGLT